MSLIKNLFPKRNIRQKLPLLPLTFSSKNGQDVPTEKQLAVSILKGHSTARTDQDAMRLLAKYPGKSANEIVKLVKRKRRFQPFMKTFLRRLKRIWG